MTGILSKEASKMQAELDHASRTVSSWQQHKPAGADSSQPNSCLCLYMFSANHISGDTEFAGAAQSDAQPQGKHHHHSDLEAHPLSLPQFEMPQLESGWLVEAVQQRFPNIGQTCLDSLHHQSFVIAHWTSNHGMHSFPGQIVSSQLNL